MNKPINLIFTPLSFYSQEDESLFFEWIKKLRCIKNFEGVGPKLKVTVTSTDISFNEYKNLCGLFERYRLDNPEQLKIFIHDYNKDWL